MDKARILVDFNELVDDNTVMLSQTDTTSAIRMFLTQAVAYNGFPFEIKRKLTEYNPYMPMTEEEMLKKLETSREHSQQGKCKNAADVISDMREKYGL